MSKGSGTAPAGIALGGVLQPASSSAGLHPPTPASPAARKAHGDKQGPAWEGQSACKVRLSINEQTDNVKVEMQCLNEVGLDLEPLELISLGDRLLSNAASRLS